MEIMSSEPASQPDSIDLAYDMWAGQFEFVGPASVANASAASTHPNAPVASKQHKSKQASALLSASSTSLSSQKSPSLESLEDLNLNLNFNTSQGQQSCMQPLRLGGGVGGQHHTIPPQQAILIDQETFLSLNPGDFDDIELSLASGPPSLVYIENKLIDDCCDLDSCNNNLENLHNNKNNNNINNFNNNNYKVATKKFNNSRKPGSSAGGGYKLENLKNFKNKLLYEFDEKSSSGSPAENGGVADGLSDPSNGHIMNGISAEMCDNLNEQLELLQRQVTDLADTQNIAEDRTTRTKTEYAVLQARYHMLEEQYRESELRAEERLAEEQKRHREILQRVERESTLQNENSQIKLKTIEIEANSLRDEAQRLRLLCDKQANDLHRNEEKLELARDQITSLQQDLDEAQQQMRKHELEKKAAEELMIELSKELERLRSETGPALPTTSPESIRLEELHQELEEMRRKTRALEEQNEELQAAVLTRGVEEGRHLLNGTLNSLAQELEEMSQAQDSVDSATLASLSQLQKAFQEKEDENTRLKHYIDTILLNIVENYPQLLEVKPIERK